MLYLVAHSSRQRYGEDGYRGRQLMIDSLPEVIQMLFDLKQEQNRACNQFLT